MIQFPTTFSEESDSRILKDQSIEQLERLNDAGYDVWLGLTKSESESLLEIALQPSIKEYCPKDCAIRLKDIPSTEAWLAKGHQFYLLKERSTGKIAGYAWSGNGSSPHIPEGKITCALRLNEDFQGRGLATPFLGAILTHTRSKYPDDTIWLEGWESNRGAIHIYKKLGFELVTSEKSTRPSKEGVIVEDTRLFMRL